MQKIKTPLGYIAYHTTAFETILWGGFGICDECNQAAEDGYLVPVLNHWQCPTCFGEWVKRGGYYPEDLPYEAKVAAYYESIIPLTE